MLKGVPLKCEYMVPNLYSGIWPYLEWFLMIASFGEVCDSQCLIIRKCDVS